METFQEFPVGKKFYPIQSEHLQERYSKMMKTDFIEACKLIDESLVGNSSYFSNHVNNLSLAVFKTNEEFPQIEVACRTLLALDESNHRYITHKASFYQTPLRINTLGCMPLIDNPIIQWDDVRKGIIVHNHPYEGELVPTKESSAVKRKLKDHLSTLLGEVGMFTLLGKELKVPMGYSWSSSDIKATNLENTISNTFSSSPKFEDVLEVALTTGVYKEEFRREPVRGYYLTRTDKPPKLYTSVRTKMLYKLGGLTLPDNYQDWFDG